MRKNNRDTPNMQLFVNALSNVDFSYLCDKHGLVGETWLANTQLSGLPDDEGMICDFGIVKKNLRIWLDETIDHCLLVPSENPNIIIIEQEDYFQITLNGNKKINCKAPKQAITLIKATSITPESVANWAKTQLGDKFDLTKHSIDLSFNCEPELDIFYQYSHGLKKHRGNCQRIAHGHRSKIIIWKDGKRSVDQMQRWAQTFENIYIASREDLTDTIDDNHHFSYQSSQGHFELSLPQNACYFIETDSTVEWIATHIAQTLKAEQPSHHFKVQAFEGLNKGAIIEL